jgi:surface antigen
MGAVTAATAISGVAALGGLGLSIGQNLRAKSDQRKAEDAQQKAINELKKLEFQDEFTELN